MSYGRRVAAMAGSSLALIRWTRAVAVSLATVLAGLVLSATPATGFDAAASGEAALEAADAVGSAASRTGPPITHWTVPPSPTTTPPTSTTPTTPPLTSAPPTTTTTSAPLPPPPPAPPPPPSSIIASTTSVPASSVAPLSVEPRATRTAPIESHSAVATTSTAGSALSRQSAGSGLSGPGALVVISALVGAGVGAELLVRRRASARVARHAR